MRLCSVGPWLSSREGPFLCRADRLDQSLNQALDSDAFGFGTVIQKNAMAKSRARQSTNVFSGDVRAIVKERADFRAEDEKLSGA